MACSFTVNNGNFKYKKNIFCLLFIALFLLFSAKSYAYIRWRSSFGSARAAAKCEKKTLLISVCTDWCPQCKKLKNNVWSDNEIADYINSNMIAIEFDGDNDRDIVSDYNIKGYPTVILLDSDGQEIARKAGYMDAEKFMKFFSSKDKHTKERNEKKLKEILIELTKKLYFARMRKVEKFIKHYASENSGGDVEKTEKYMQELSDLKIKVKEIKTLFSDVIKVKKTKGMIIKKKNIFYIDNEKKVFKIADVSRDIKLNSLNQKKVYTFKYYPLDEIGGKTCIYLKECSEEE